MKCRTLAGAGILLLHSDDIKWHSESSTLNRRAGSDFRMAHARQCLRLFQQLTIERNGLFGIRKTRVLEWQEEGQNVIAANSQIHPR